MKTGLTFNVIQEVFSRVFALTTGNEPYPLHSLLLREQSRLRPRTVLDLGCGSGRFVLGDCEYVGIDPNPKYIDYCRKHLIGRFEQMSGEQLRLPDQHFDMVLSFSVGHHVPDTRLSQVFAEARRVLKDDGVFLFGDVVRPIVGWRSAASLLEWLDEGESFRTEDACLALLAPYFIVEHREALVDQFYRTVVLRCRKA
jgi:SAM-dependent methyltransferase